MLIHILGTIINSDTIEKISRIDEKTVKFHFISGENSSLSFKSVEDTENFLDYLMRKLDSVNYHDVVEFIQEKTSAKKRSAKK